MLWTLIRKELLANLLTLRFSAALLFTVALTTLAAWLGSLDYARSLDQYRAKTQEERAKLDGLRIYSDLAFELVLPPAKLAVLGSGQVKTHAQSYFAGSGQLVDQAFQERLAAGMVRCYFVKDKVAGFGEQLVNALFPYPSEADRADAPQPGKRLYYPPTRPDFQVLKSKAEEEWIPEMLQVLDLDSDSLPVLWDADFLYGPQSASGEDTYVLCEINVSAVFPFPDEALDPLAAEVASRLGKTEGVGH